LNIAWIPGNIEYLHKLDTARMAHTHWLVRDGGLVLDGELVRDGGLVLDGELVLVLEGRLFLAVAAAAWLHLHHRLDPDRGLEGRGGRTGGGRLPTAQFVRQLGGPRRPDGHYLGAGCGGSSAGQH